MTSKASSITKACRFRATHDVNLLFVPHCFGTRLGLVVIGSCALVGRSFGTLALSSGPIRSLLATLVHPFGVRWVPLYQLGAAPGCSQPLLATQENPKDALGSR